MSKVMTFGMILFGLLAMFSIFGLADTSMSQLLQVVAFDNPEDLKGFDLFKILFDSTAGIIATLTALGTIIIGLYTRDSPAVILTAGFTSLLAGWIVGDTISLISSFDAIGSEFSFIVPVIKTILLGLLLGFIISIVQWWKGSD